MLNSWPLAKDLQVLVEIVSMHKAPISGLFTGSRSIAA